MAHAFGGLALDTTKIGVKSSKCACGEVGEEVLVTPSEIDFTQNTFGDLINYHPTDLEEKVPGWNFTKITGEPTWEDWGHRPTVTKDTITYSNAHDWDIRKVALPNINYSLFTKVSFGLSVDKNPASNMTTIACSFDTIDNRDGSFVEITNIASKTGTLSVTQRHDGTYVMNIKYGEVDESLVVTDENVINGNSPLYFYTCLLGNKPSVTLSNLTLLKEAEHAFVEQASTTTIGQNERICANCGAGESAHSDTFAADFENNKYGANIALETETSNPIIGVKVNNNADNSLSYVANVDYNSSTGHQTLTYGMELPRMDLRNRDGIVSFPIQAASNGIRLSLGGQETANVNAVGTKGAIVFSHITESSMKVTVDIGGSTISKNYTDVANIINGSETFKDLKLIGFYQWTRELKLYAPSAKAPVGLHLEQTSGPKLENLKYSNEYTYGLLYLSINSSEWASFAAKLDFYRLDYRKCGKVVYDVGSRNKDTGTVEDNSANVFLQLDEETSWNVGKSTEVRSYISFEMVNGNLKVTAWNEDNNTNAVTNEKSVIITDENVIKGLESYSVNMTFGNNWRHFTINSITFVD